MVPLLCRSMFSLRGLHAEPGSRPGQTLRIHSRTILGHLPNISGRLADIPRTSAGHLPDISRTSPAHIPDTPDISRTSPDIPEHSRTCACGDVRERPGDVRSVREMSGRCPGGFGGYPGIVGRSQNLTRAPPRPDKKPSWGGSPDLAHVAPYVKTSVPSGLSASRAVVSAANLRKQSRNGSRQLLCSYPCGLGISPVSNVLQPFQPVCDFDAGQFFSLFPGRWLDVGMLFGDFPACLDYDQLVANRFISAPSRMGTGSTANWLPHEW